ncbi:MAG: hypothetical protein CMF60_04260 [Magnetococcales bacterium]|nr:hypothetical protein [Magnetococcales bacterium]|tara:strand:- start:25 stop:480 length:456 start_codon:yes stop_codon:yes gene_type:complete
MSQKSPLNVIALPTTVQELEERVKATLEHYQSHLPTFFALEMPNTQVNSPEVVAYTAQLKSSFSKIQANGLPNPEDLNFEEIKFDPKNAEDFLKRSCILECSVIHALATGVIDQQTFDSAGVSLMSGLMLPLIFHFSEEVGVYPLSNSDCA